jgi:hypothetical protein
VANRSQNLLLILHDDIQGFFVLLDFLLVSFDFFLVPHDQAQLVLFDLFLFLVLQNEDLVCDHPNEDRFRRWQVRRPHPLEWNRQRNDTVDGCRD